MSDPAAASPPSYTPRACKRCSIHKKKCDRLVPRCTGCALASVPCEAPLKSTDRRLMRQVDELRDENITLKKQIAYLERELGLQNETLEGAGHTMYSLGASLPSSGSFSSLPTLSVPLLASNDHPVLSRHSLSTVPLGVVLAKFGLQAHDFIAELDTLDQENESTSSSSNQLVGHNEMSIPSILHALPSKEETRGIIKSLIESAKHGPSNIDKIIDLAQLEEDCRLVYGPNGFRSPEFANNRFRCFITVYLALCMAAAVNDEDVKTDTRAIACRMIGMKELASVTLVEDLACVEALTLLCELAIHEPNSPSLWQLVGLAGRTAVAINLHRRDSVYMPTVYPSWPAVEEEPAIVTAHNQRRKDLFWAFYSLDRLTTFTLNRPAAIRDEDIDVDLPPLTMWLEGKYGTASSEALWVHHLQARRLYGQIYDSLYAVSRQSERDSASQPEDVVARYVHQVQQWYMWSRFNATVVPFSDDSVKRHLLDDIQYHQIMIALHQPSPLIPRPSSTFIATLKRSASLSVNLFHHSVSGRQLNIHWINLYHCFASCAVLIYCFRQYQIRPDLVAVPHNEVTEMLSRCRQTLSLFRGAGASLVTRYEVMLDKIIRFFELQQQEVTSTESVLSPPAHRSTPGGESPPDSNQASLFDVDMLVNGLLQAGNFTNMNSSPTFAEGGMSSELATFMNPGTWATTAGQDPKSWPKI